MRRLTHVWMLGLALTLCVAVFVAQAAKPPRRSPAAAAPGAKAPGAPRAAGADSSAATRGRPRVAPRILDDIRIEGEIPVPQVLFITARDQRRFMEFQHHRYQVTSLELGRATPAPSGLVVPTARPDESTQEDKR
jgi:hypothetical protein